MTPIMHHPDQIDLEEAIARVTGRLDESKQTAPACAVFPGFEDLPELVKQSAAMPVPTAENLEERRALARLYQQELTRAGGELLQARDARADAIRGNAGAACIQQADRRIKSASDAWNLADRNLRAIREGLS